MIAFVGAHGTARDLFADGQSRRGEDVEEGAERRPAAEVEERPGPVKNDELDFHGTADFVQRRLAQKDFCRFLKDRLRSGRIRISNLEWTPCVKVLAVRVQIRLNVAFR